MDNKFFPVCRLHREDLKWIGLDADELTDEQMQEIAQKMGNAYLECGYWTDLEIIAEERGVPELKSSKQTNSIDTL